MICCTNKCIINERYIPEHQNKLNIYDLQNYEFFTNFFSTEKKFVKFQKLKKFVKFEFSIYDLNQQTEATYSMLMPMMKATTTMSITPSNDR